MSRLKELRLHGFKSFADPTRFVFESGVNAVIGPNGSGKSNMADAVRWVLGEQSNRSLRTRRADDVIFAGSEQRKPQGMAEAVLTLDNADGWLPIEFAEVSIGRRAYRSGEGEYLINGARARLRDVVALLGEGRLGANELVVVGQGTVDAALSLRPEERRQLFEEAAGVKGLQVKRNEASVRLAKALDNLTRVSDLIAELKPQARRLALQAEHQQQHDALGARARGLVIASHQRREVAARAALGDARRAAAAAEAGLAGFREAQAAGRQAIAAAEERYWHADEAARQAARAREATREAVIRIEGRLETAGTRLSELVTTLERETAELAEAEHVLSSSDEDAAGEVDAAVADAAAAEEAWRAAVAELATADDALLAAEEAVAALRAAESDRIAAAARTSEEVARHAARRDDALLELERVRAAGDEARSAVSTTTAARDAADAAVRDAERAFSAAETERDAAQAEADETRQRVVEGTERLRATRAELTAIEEPADASTRLGRRLAAAGWPSLLDTIEAPEPTWPAIEAVVGGELEGVLLWADADPREQVDAGRGAARLLAPHQDDGLDGREAALAAVEADQTLAEWVAAADAPLIFRRTAVARDLEALLAGWRRLPAGWSAVTTDGDLADGRGVITLRGRADASGGAAARAHARRRELIDTTSRLETDVASAQEVAHRAADRLRAARAVHLSARERHDEAERTQRRAIEEADTAVAAQERLDERAAALESELVTMDDARTPPTTDIGVGSGDLEQLQAAAEAARAGRDERARRRDEAREAWTTTRGSAEGLEISTAGRRRDRALRESRVAQLRASLPERERLLAIARAEHDAIETEARAVRASDAAASADLERADSERGTARNELLALERDQGSVGGELSDLERAAQATAIDASRREEALTALARERELALDGLPEVGSTEIPVDEIGTLDDDALEVELKRVRRTLGQIGSVNPFAVEEHREVATRLDEMTGQDGDLRAAISATEELIARLDEEIGQQFDAAFRAIGEKFDEFCRLLFAGGIGVTPDG